jgi:hypothetical protein
VGRLLLLLLLLGHHPPPLQQLQLRLQVQLRALSGHLHFPVLLRHHPLHPAAVAAAALACSQPAMLQVLLLLLLLSPQSAADLQSPQSTQPCTKQQPHGVN